MMRAIDLLASVAEKLQEEEGETSSNSINAFEEWYYNQNHLAGKISLKDPSQLHVQCPEPVHLDGVPNEYRNRSKLVCRDDDENCCKYYKCKDKCNKSYSPSLTWAGHRRAVHRSKCFEGTKTG